LVRKTHDPNNIIERTIFHKLPKDKKSSKGGRKMSCGHGRHCCRQSCCKIVKTSRGGSGVLLLLLLGTLLALRSNPTGVAGASQNTNIININSDRDDFDDDECDIDCDCHSKCCRY
jgi:hypothetical protein